MSGALQWGPVFLLALLLFLPSAAGCGGSADKTVLRASPLWVGVAVEDITPDLERYGTLRPMAYLFTPPARGVKDPLYARVLVLDNGIERAAWVVLDTCLIERFFCDAVHSRLTSGIRREHLFVSAVHSHGGIAHIQEQPAFQFLYGAKKPELLADTAEKVAAAVDRAARSLEPATFSRAAMDLERMNQSRRPFSRPPLEDRGTDPEMTVLVFSGEAGEPLAVVSNFAAHPTLTPTWQEPYYTSDFVGVFNDAVERRYGGGLSFPEGGGVLSLFTNGILGDAEPYYPDPVEREIQSWEKRIEYGHRLAEAAFPVVDAARARAGRAEVVLAAGSFTFPMPEVVPAHPLIELLVRVFPLITYDVAMTALRVDDVLVSFFPGEPTTPVGLGAIKNPLKAVSGLHVIVAAASNDYLSYVPDRRQYDEGTGTGNYERFICMFGPDTGEIFSAAARRAARGLY